MDHPNRDGKHRVVKTPCVTTFSPGIRRRGSRHPLSGSDEVSRPRSALESCSVERAAGAGVEATGGLPALSESTARAPPRRPHDTVGRRFRVACGTVERRRQGNVWALLLSGEHDLSTAPHCDTNSNAPSQPARRSSSTSNTSSSRTAPSSPSSGMAENKPASTPSMASPSPHRPARTPVDCSGWWHSAKPYRCSTT